METNAVPRSASLDKCRHRSRLFSSTCRGQTSERSHLVPSALRAYCIDRRCSNATCHGAVIHALRAEISRHHNPSDPTSSTVLVTDQTGMRGRKPSPANFRIPSVRSSRSPCRAATLATPASSLLVAYLPGSSRHALFGDGRGVAAGPWAPRGTGSHHTVADEVFMPADQVLSLFAPTPEPSCLQAITNRRKLVSTRLREPHSALLGS